MKRREFIAGIGSAAAWPVVVRGQQPAMPVIGYLGTQSADVDYKKVTVPFLQGLKATGYVEGQNVAIEYRWAAYLTVLPPNSPINAPTPIFQAVPKCAAIVMLATPQRIVIKKTPQNVRANAGPTGGLRMRRGCPKAFVPWKAVEESASENRTSTSTIPQTMRSVNRVNPSTILLIPRLPAEIESRVYRFFVCALFSPSRVRECDSFCFGEIDAPFYRWSPDCASVLCR
jgi:hypothetical protein